MLSMIADIIHRLRGSGLRGHALRQQAMESLSHLPGYDWCGVYGLEGGNLKLGAFVGAPTDHTVIPVGVGICGTAIAENRNLVIPDVREVQNYLACSLETRAEIVVLIRRQGEIIGQIDIDSHTAGAFSASDESALAALAELLAERWD